MLNFITLRFNFDQDSKNCCQKSHSFLSPSNKCTLKPGVQFLLINFAKLLDLALTQDPKE